MVGIWRVFVIALALTVGSAWAQPTPTGRISKSQIPPELPLLILAQTWNATQTFSMPITFGPTATAQGERQVGFNSPNLGFFEGGVFWPFAQKGLVGGADPLQYSKINLIPSGSVTITRTESPAGQLNYTFSVSGSGWDGNLQGLALSNTGSGYGGKVAVDDADGFTVYSDKGVSLQATGGSPNFGGIVHLYGTTTTAAPTKLAMNAGGTVFLPVLNNTTHGFTFMVVGRGVSGTNAGKCFQKVIKCTAENTGGTSRMVNAGVTETIVEEIVAWDAAVGVDDVTDVIDMVVTGDADTTIRWTVRVDETRAAN